MGVWLDIAQARTRTGLWIALNVTRAEGRTDEMAQTTIGLFA